MHGNVVDEFNERLNGAVAIIMVFAGPRPKSTEDPVVGVRLMGLLCPPMLDGRPIFPLSPGRPDWFRAYNPQGNVIADGDVGDGIGADLLVSTSDWRMGMPVEVKTPKLFTTPRLNMSGIMARG